ncbi:MAG: UTP--glucose-1-phosphate uridylyltransferase [Thermoplasmatales archaeon]
MAKIRKCVIPAAGVGSRFYPLTRAQPKEMLPVLDKPVIHYVVEEAVRSGLDEILIIVGAGKDSIINYFDTNRLDSLKENSGFINFPDIYFIRQKSPLGLGDSLKYARTFTGDDPFTVLLGDTIYRSDFDSTVTSDILALYEKRKVTTISLEKVTPEKFKDYGIIRKGKQFSDFIRITGVVEKPKTSDAPSDLGITGIYVFEPDIYDYIDRLKPGINAEYQLSDAINQMCSEKEVIGKVIRGKRFDVGTKELWIKTFIEFASLDSRFKSILKDNIVPE